MRTMIAVSAATLAVLAASPGLGQQGDPSVGSYLCQFANKCDATTSPDPVTAAPAPSPAGRVSGTRGFRVVGTSPAAAPPAAPVAAPGRPTRVGMRRQAPAPVGAGKRVDLRLSFDYNSDEMTPAARAKASVFAQALMTPELRGMRFLIEGHTDARGSRTFNVDLSRRRARSVADFLIAQGVDARNVVVRGVGSAEPLPGQPANAEANRRVEAVLLS